MAVDLSKLQWAKTPSVDFSILGDLPETWRNAKKAGARDRALASLDAGATPEEASQALLKAGAVDDAMSLAKLTDSRSREGYLRTKDERDFNFRVDEAMRTQRNADRTYGLTAAQLEGGKVPAGYRRTADGNLEAIPGGPGDKKPEVPFDNEMKLRKEFEGSIKPYLETRRGYQRLLASKDTAAGDISMIFGYMKMLDPGSVVREGEFATAQNAAGIPDQIRNAYNRALSGQRLNPDQRKMFQGQAGALYEGARQEYDTREKQTRGMAGQYGLDVNRVIIPLGRVGANASPYDMPAPPAGFEVMK